MVTPRDRRDHRDVDDPQIVDPAQAAILVDDGARVALRPHPRCPQRVAIGADIVEHVGSEQFVGKDDVLRQADDPLGLLHDRHGSGDPPGEPNSRHQPSQVLPVGAEVQLDARLDVRIGARQAETAVPARPHQGDVDQRDHRHAGLREQARERRQIQVTHQDHLHVFHFGRIWCCEPSHHLKPGIPTRDALPGFGDEPDGDGRMVPQLRADAGQVAAHLDSERFEVGGRADPGAQQDPRRGDGAGREHNPPAMDLLARSLAGQLDPHRAPIVEQYPPDRAVGLNREVRPAAGRPQIAERRRDACGPLPVHRPRADAAAPRIVVVDDVGKAERTASLAERPLDRDQLGLAVAADRKRPAGSMQGTRRIALGLETLEVGQNAVPGPLRVAELGPFCEVGWSPPHGGSGVGPWPMNRDGTTRISTALAYLGAARGRSNLTIQPNSPVGRVLLDDGRAVGVEVAGERSGEQVHGRRILLSAGAIASPAILLRSGIGP
ncbi:MAG TPA: GMC family oxidoreductase N-terminal domain-containing protein, partial [Candidatus Polarisedimenticolia bacterium]|nr:GMC family oxidoreductase N-terminal domain-containing protein [Candidatus Polarisedimenticolia bacterium]